MKTRKQIIAEGYPEDWASKCTFCGSWYCHEYNDVIFCFDCKKRVEKDGK